MKKTNQNWFYETNYAFTTDNCTNLYSSCYLYSLFDSFADFIFKGRCEIGFLTVFIFGFLGITKLPVLEFTYEVMQSLLITSNSVFRP